MPVASTGAGASMAVSAHDLSAPSSTGASVIRSGPAHADCRLYSGIKLEPRILPRTGTRPGDAVPMFRDNWRLRLHSSWPLARSKGRKLSAILPAGGRAAAADHCQQHLPEPFPAIAAAPMGQAWQLHRQNAGGVFRCGAAVVPCA